MSINIVISREYEALRPFITRLAHEGVPQGATEIYRARNRVYTCPTLPYGPVVCIKAFRAPAFPNNVVYTHLRPSKARRSYEYSQRLIDMGFDAPAPVAYVEVTRQGCLSRSYYVNVAVQGHNLREWETRPDAAGLVADLARYMVRLHRAGVFHKDFSPGNVLVTRDALGQRHFNLIDVNRMRFNEFDPRLMLCNFRCINLDRVQTALLAEAYGKAVVEAGAEAGATALGAVPPGSSLCAEAVAQLDRYEASRARRRRLKRLLKGRQ